MEKLMRIKKYLSHQFIWVNLLAFILPILFKQTPAFILFFALVVLVQSKLRVVKLQVQNKVWWFTSLYLFYLLATLWTEHTSELGAELETKLSLLIFPILFLFTKPLPKSILNKVLLNFVLGCFVNVIASTINGYECFLEEGIVECFYSSRLAFSFHPSYLAMYLNFAVAILLYFDVHKLNPYYIKRWMIWVLIIVFSVFLVLLSSKMGIITLFVVLLVFFLYHLKLYSWKRTIFKSLTPVVVFTICLLVAPVTQKRLQKMSEVVKDKMNNVQIDVAQAESNAARINVWEVAFSLAKDNFLIGLGTGDVTTTLVEAYKEKGMTEAADKRLNCHNQFFETFLATGFFGFILLASFMLVGIVLALRRKSFIYLIYIVICGCHFMVESMLETQAGVVYFAFFNCLLFAQLNHIQDNKVV